MAISPIDSVNFNSKAGIQSTKGYNRTFRTSQLKNIEGNCCACCGHPMITYGKISEVWANITRPISETILHEKFNIIKENYSTIYKTLEDFVRAYPKQSLDGILTDEINHSIFMDSVEKSFTDDKEYHYSSAIDRLKALKDRTMAVLKISAITLKDSSEVMKYLMPLRGYMYNYRGEILDEFAELSTKYPDKKLSEILKIPEVAEKHVTGTYDDMMERVKIRDYHWNNVNNLILSKKPDANSDLETVNTQVCQIYRNPVDPKRVTYEIQEVYNNLLQKYELGYLEKEVAKEIARMPNEWFTKNSFMAYARRYYTDGGIVSYMLKNFMESEEHIVPVSLNGSNSISNKINICRACNYMRGRLRYSEFLLYHPEMIQNTKNQVNFIAKRILDGLMSFDLYEYPIKVSKTLVKSTRGLIKPDLQWYINELQKRQVKIKIKP